MTDQFTYFIHHTKYNNRPKQDVWTTDIEGVLGYITTIFAMLGGNVDDLQDTDELTGLEKTISFSEFGRQLDITQMLKTYPRIISHGEEAFEMDESEFPQLGRRWNMTYAVKLNGSYGSYVLQYDVPSFLEGVKKAVGDLGLNTSPRGGYIGDVHMKANRI